MRISVVLPTLHEADTIGPAIVAARAVLGNCDVIVADGGSEDGTPAAEMDGVVPDELMQERLRECVEVQDPITQAARDALVGTDLEVLIDRADDDTGEPLGRSHREAPEIDGVIRITDAFARTGARVRARVTEACGPDLVAEPA